MKRFAAVPIAVLIIALALMRTAMSDEQGRLAFSGGSGFRGLVVKTDSGQSSIQTTLPDWNTVDSRGFQIPAGESQLVVVDFFAETICGGTFAAKCLVRVLVGRTLPAAQELAPAAGGNADSAIDSAPEDDDSAEAHAMSRALCVRNATASPLNISVFIQATRGSNTATTFLIDDWTFKIARNAPCSPSVDV